MKLFSQIVILLFLSAFLLSVSGKAGLLDTPERIEDPYLPILKQKCVSALTRSCKDSASNPDNNFLSLLMCLETNLDKLDEQCQKEFFIYKFRLYTNPAFLSTLDSLCGGEMSSLCEGKQGPMQIGCLFGADSSRIKGACSSYLGQIGQVVLSDYAVLSDLQESCAAEIDSLGCTVGIGRLGVFGSPTIKIVQCLMANTNKLSAKCGKKFSSEGGKSKLEVEMHEECKIDFSKLCDASQSESGDYNFRCLMSQLSEISSPSCLERLLEGEAYYFRTIDIGIDFYQFCSDDVKREQCASSKVMKSSSEGEFTKLTDLLSCLGRDSSLLSEECGQEVELLRERFIGEEILSVDFARACETAREKFCSHNFVSLTDCLKDSLEENRDAQFKECRGHLKLLTSPLDPATVRLPQPKQGPLPPIKQEPIKQGALPIKQEPIPIKQEPIKQGDLPIKQEPIPVKQGALPIKQEPIPVKQEPIKQGDLPIKQEPIPVKQGALPVKQGAVKEREFSNSDLEVFCSDELDSLCSTSRNSEYKNTLFCLAHHQSDPDMSQDCSSHVGRAMYFSDRALVFDSKLDRGCMEELGDICDTDESGRIACLVSHHAAAETGAEEISPQCAYEIEEFLRSYAASNEMQENLFSDCLPYLGQFCPSQGSHHSELECLREHQELIEHTSSCFNQLEEFNAVEEKMPSVNANVQERCHEAILAFCPHVSSHEAVGCLQESLNIPGFDPGCKKALTHALEVSDPEWNLDSQLNKNCKRDISQHCPHTTRVQQAINCLNAVYTSGVLSKICSAYIDTMFDQGDNSPVVPQVKVYSPASSLETNCAKEIQLFCATIPNEKHLECLINFKLDARVSAACQKAVITEEIDFVVRKLMDKETMTDCGEDIRNYCMFESRYEVLLCLQSMANAGAINPACEKKLDKASGSLNKLQLDKNLAIECHSAAFQKCKQKLGNSEKLVNCLSQHMRELETAGENKKCINEVVVLIGQAQLDINKDPDLAEKCQSELSKFCGNVAMGHGEKIRCLFKLREERAKLMSSSCSRALLDRQELWSSLSKRYPNIQRGVEAILDDFEILKQRVYPNIIGILKGIFLLGLLIGIVVICCLCRATRRVRRKIL